jgi:hypothetical protein
LRSKKGIPYWSPTDEEGAARVRNNFMKKKLGLANSDPELDKAIMLVGDKMKGDRGESLLPARRPLRKAVDVRLTM